MKKQTVLNVVIHQGGGFRFGLICGEYLESPPEKVIIRNLLDSKDIELSPAKCFYLNGSIYSKEISAWIINNGFGRHSNDNMALFKFFYERHNDVVIFEFVETSLFVKEPNRQVLVFSGLAIQYKKDELIKLVWDDKEWIENHAVSFADSHASNKTNRIMKFIIPIMIIIAIFIGVQYSIIGFDTVTCFIPACAFVFFGSRIISGIIYRTNL